MIRQERFEVWPGTYKLLDPESLTGLIALRNNWYFRWLGKPDPCDHVRGNPSCCSGVNKP